MFVWGWGDSETDHKAIACDSVDYVTMIHDRVKWLALVSAVMNLLTMFDSRTVSRKAQCTASSQTAQTDSVKRKLISVSSVAFKPTVLLISSRTKYTHDCSNKA
jgi:hypothetical protein